jgi:hypothetical protein
MTLDEYRLECGWGKNEMCRQASIDFVTLQRGLSGETVSSRSAEKLAHAISKKLGRTIRPSDIEGLNVK